MELKENDQLEAACIDFLKGCTNAKPTEPFKCRECTEAFTKRITAILEDRTKEKIFVREKALEQILQSDFFMKASKVLDMAEEWLEERKAKDRIAPDDIKLLVVLYKDYEGYNIEYKDKDLEWLYFKANLLLDPEVREEFLGKVIRFFKNKEVVPFDNSFEFEVVKIQSDGTLILRPL